MTSQAEPTGLNINDMKFTRMITVLNGRRHSHVRPANTESDLVTVTNSTAAIQSLSEHRGALITAHKVDKCDALMRPPQNRGCFGSPEAPCVSSSRSRPGRLLRAVW